MNKLKFPPIFEPWKGALARYKYVLLVLCIGLILLQFPTETQELTKEIEQEAFDITAFEIHLAENLSHIQGAGETNVVLTLKNDGQKIYAQDTQRQSGGDSKATTVTVGSGSGEQVVAVQQVFPEFQGALVVCSGGDSPAVQLQLIKAVSALTGLGSDHITVCKSED